ncbi:MAG: AsmA family protein, partial [Chitinivibrionales bacterium]|nr:AsmA family protein [Chitinivibrionales bacterium]MBD3357710.1 AsmA family protein [Chitinivibrionales bacterium]
MSKKKTMRIIIGLAVIAVILPVAVIITLRATFPPDKVKDMVLPHLEKAVGREVTVEGAGISIFPVFGTKISGVTIADTKREGFSEEPFVTLDGFFVGVRLLPLFQRKLEIKEVVIKNLKLLVETDTTGSFNYEDLAFMGGDEDEAAKAPKKKTPGGMPALPIPLTLERFAIENAEIVYNDRRSGRYVTLGDIDQRVDIAMDKELRDITSTGELVVSDVSVKTAEISKPLTGFTVTFSHDIWANAVEGKAKINTVRASLQKIALEMTGRINDFIGTPKIDVAVKSDKIFIEDVIDEVPVELVPEVAKLEAEGFVEMTMDLAGTIDSSGIPRLAGHVSFGDGKIKYEDLPKAINGLNADIKFTGTSLTVKKFAFKLGDNPVEVRAEVEDFARPTVDAGLKATVNLGDLKDIMKLPEGVTVGGMIRSDVTAKGKVDPADPTKLDVGGKVVLSEVKATSPDVAKPILVNGKSDFTNRAVTGDITVQIGSSDLAIDTRLADYLALVVADSTQKAPRPTLSYTVKSSLLNVDEILVRSQKTGAPQEEPAQAPAHLLAAPLPGVDVNGSVLVKKLVYGGVTLNDAKTQMSAVNDIVELSADAGLFKGSLSNKLRLDARNIRDIGFTNKLTIDRIRVSELVPVARGFLGDDQGLVGLVEGINDIVAGGLNLTTDMRGHGATVEDLTKTLEGEVEARLSNGTVKAGKFTESFTKAIN